MTAACGHFKSLTVREDWLRSPSTFAQQLLADDRLRVQSEEEVYEAAIAWLRAREPAADAESVAAILALVRLPLASEEFVRDVVLKEPLLLTMPQQMRQGILASIRGSTTRDDAVSPRGKIRKLLAISFSNVEASESGLSFFRILFHITPPPFVKPAMCALPGVWTVSAV